MSTQTVATLPAYALKGLLLIAADGDVRHYLNGIHFDPTTGIFTATNGKALLLYRSFEQSPVNCPPFILPRAEVETAVKLSTRTVPGITITTDLLLPVDRDGKPAPRTLTLAAAKGQVSAKEIDGQYPEVAHVIPTNPNLKPAQFNPQLLAQLHRAIAFCLNTGRASDDVLAANLITHGKGAALMTCSAPHVLGAILPWPVSEPDEAQKQTQEALSCLRLIATQGPAASTA